MFYENKKVIIDKTPKKRRKPDANKIVLKRLTKKSNIQFAKKDTEIWQMVTKSPPNTI
jgi:hypothetical protein